MTEFPFSAKDLLSPMKVDLGIKSDAYDERLLDKLQAAMEEITAEGATLQATSRDRNLVLMYAEWQWSNRMTQAEMQRMLRKALNNRVFGEKAREALP